jgi:hypothetical protein
MAMEAEVGHLTEEVTGELNIEEAMEAIVISKLPTFEEDEVAWWDSYHADRDRCLFNRHKCDTRILKARKARLADAKPYTLHDAYITEKGALSSGRRSRKRFSLTSSFFTMSKMTTRLLTPKTRRAYSGRKTSMRREAFVTANLQIARQTTSATGQTPNRSRRNASIYSRRSVRNVQSMV